MHQLYVTVPSHGLFYPDPLPDVNTRVSPSMPSWFLPVPFVSFQEVLGVVKFMKTKVRGKRIQEIEVVWWKNINRRVP
jgi:hypothetical protein